MSQTVALAAGVTEEVSADIVVTVNPVTVGIFSAPGGLLPTGVTFHLLQKTPGASNSVDRLNNEDRALTITGPGTYVVVRPAYVGTAFGVFTDVFQE